MPFGSFRTETRTGKDKPPVKEKPFKAASSRPTPSFASASINILLIGRNLSILREFLCSMNQNMTKSLQEDGIAFYTQELKSISDITEKKKQLERFFWSFSQADWTYPEDENGEDLYRFSISPSGDQKNVLELVFRCVTPGAEDFSIGQANAVWLVTDSLLLKPGTAADSYTSFLQEILQTLGQEAAEVPVCIVLSQIESLSRFNNINGQNQLSRDAVGQLARICQEQFRAFCGSEHLPMLIPVQIYGGLEFSGVDDKGDPLLHIGQSSFYQSYIPENCHIPVLCTLQNIIAARQQDFFPDDTLSHSIQSHYNAQFANIVWQSSNAGGEAN